MLVWSRKFIWYLLSRLVVGLILLIAVYASLGQYYAPFAASYKTPILEFINRYAPVNIEADSLNITWRRLSPILELENVRIRRDTDDIDFIEIDALSTSVNVLASFRDRGVRLDHLRLAGMSLDLVENSRRLSSGQDDLPWRDLWLQFLGTLEYADMINVERSHVVTALGELDLYFELGRNDNFRRLIGELVLNQAPLSFVVEANGSLVDAETLRGKAYFVAADVNFDRLGLDNVLTENPIPEDLSASTEMWLDWHPSRGISAQGSFSVPRIDLSKLLPNVGDISQVSSNFLLNYQSTQQWDLSLSETTFDFHKPFKQEAMRIIMGRENANPVLTVSAPSIDLNLMHNVMQKIPAVRNGKLISVIEALKPSGLVKGLNLSLPINDFASTKFSGRLQNVSIGSYQNLPAASNISGVLRGSASSGSLNLGSENVQLQLPSTYKNALLFDRLQGHFKWWMDDNGFRLRSNRFAIESPDGEMAGFLGLDLPPKGALDREPTMDLLVSLQGGQVSSVERYLPYKLKADLRDWLVSALQSGDVASAAVLYRGSIAIDSTPEQRTLQMNYVTRAATFQYSPEWPVISELDAVVNVDDSRVDVAMSRGVSSGVVMTNMMASAAPSEHFATWLEVSGDISGESGDALALLLNSPLKKNLAPVLGSWVASGSSEGRITLGLPLSGEQPLQEALNVDVRVQLTDNLFSQPSSRLSFSGVNGTLQYRHDQGLTSESLQSVFLDNPLKVEITSRLIEKVWLPQIAMTGNLNITALGHWLQTPIFDFMKGEAAMNAELLTDSQGARLTFSSSLQGIHSGLPLPLSKAAKQAWPLQGSLSLGEERQLLSLAVKDVLDVRAQMENYTVSGVQLALNGSAAALPELPGVYLTGYIDSIVLKDWRPIFAHYAALGGTSQTPNHIGFRQLHIDSADVYGYALSDIDLFGDSVLDFWHIYVDDDAVKGTAAIYSDGRPPRVALEFLDLQPFLSSEDELSSLRDDTFWRDLDFNNIPNIDVSVAVLRRAERALGNWAFELRSEKDQLSLQNVVAEHNDLVIEGTSQSLGANFFWQRGENSITRMDGVFRMGNIAEHMEAIGVPPTMTSERAGFDISAQWPGQPNQFDAQSLVGRVDVDITNGMFLNVPDSATSALNLTNLFNFGALVQRLKLDFSDLTNGGVRYDKVLGKMTFSDGTMNIVDSIEIEGPSSEFSISGGADLLKREVDLSLVAVLPITGNISLITAATANLPAAVGVFVVSKLFKKQFDKLSSVVYHITGPWDDPDIQFNKLFDVGNLPSQQAVPR